MVEGDTRIVPGLTMANNQEGMGIVAHILWSAWALMATTKRLSLLSCGPYNLSSTLSLSPIPHPYTAISGVAASRLFV